MTEGIRQRLISQLTNLKKQNKKSVSLSVDYVLDALSEPESMPNPSPERLAEQTLTQVTLKIKHSVNPEIRLNNDTGDTQ